ncbi:hypothetical protein HMI54_006012 [Coelomomyces lativittatus]|nr:hypothetical protein HMI56_002147 [Coelomomyces lativittatus]KAJ1505380.1 hypothetical protein HMI54_006012 [Coelomomyces lativittatus]
MPPSEAKEISNSTQALLSHGNEVWKKKRLEKINKQKKQVVFDEEERNKFICSFPFRNVERKKKEALNKEKRKKRERNRHITLKRKELADHYVKMVSEIQAIKKKTSDISERKTLFSDGDTVTTVTINDTPPFLSGLQNT